MTCESENLNFNCGERRNALENRRTNDTSYTHTRHTHKCEEWTKRSIQSIISVVGFTNVKQTRVFYVKHVTDKGKTDRIGLQSLDCDCNPLTSNQ